MASSHQDLSNIDDLIRETDSDERGYKVFAGSNLGYRTYLAHFPMHRFFEISDVANDPVRDGDSLAQRKLDPAHVRKLASYVLKGLAVGAINQRESLGKAPLPSLGRIYSNLGRQPYLSLQPIVANIRTVQPGGRDIRARRIETASGETAAFEIFLSQRHVLWVVDGQHRRMAMKLVFDFLDSLRRTGSYPKRDSLYPSGRVDVDPDEAAAWEEVYSCARTTCKVAVEIHVGLDPEQERQLFHDLNNLGKKIDKSLALKFDNSNPINLFIKDILFDTMGIKISESEVKDWDEDPGALVWKDAVAVNAILFLNKTNISGAAPADVASRESVAKQFWEAVAGIAGFGEEGAKAKTVAAQPVVLKALAKLTHDFAFSSRKTARDRESLHVLLTSISDLDFSHENPMWRYYSLSDDERRRFGVLGLGDFLPAVEKGNRDIGAYQGGYMRFGAKHNDIYPIIGDMIRWRLGLQSRRI
jgi:hypothetical protein